MIISAKCFLNAFKHSRLYVFGLASVIGAVAAFKAFAEHSWLSAAQLIIDETKSLKLPTSFTNPPIILYDFVARTFFCSDFALFAPLQISVNSFIFSTTHAGRSKGLCPALSEHTKPLASTADDRTHHFFVPAILNFLILICIFMSLN